MERDSGIIPFLNIHSKEIYGFQEVVFRLWSWYCKESNKQMTIENNNFI
jgi:hypothetical protein